MKKLIFALFALVLSTEVFAVFASCPGGSVYADGTTFTASSFPELYTCLGNSTTKPNATGRFLRNVGGNGPLIRATQEDAFQSHIHGELAGSGSGGSNYLSATTNVNNSTGSNFGFTSSPQTDGSFGTPRTANETRPQNIGVNYCIRY